MNDSVRKLVAETWAELGAAARPCPPLELEGETGAAGGLPSVYAVDAFAAAMVATAGCSLADVAGARGGKVAPTVTVDRKHAAVAFRSERYLERVGHELPPLWDPVAGDYRTSDGWVRLHTNYAHHRAAALQALEVSEDRAAVTARLSSLTAEEVEERVVAAGGCAAKMRTAAEWAAHPQGIAVAAEPLVSLGVTAIAPSARRPLPFAGAAAATGGLLAGVRVLDLTRVIAGPVCTRVLAAHGADVLRLDPPGFEENLALLADVTAGKRRATLDLRSSAERSRFLELVAEADLLVTGLRAGALERLGLGVESLRQANPSLGIVALDAYGWSGPWRERRGFDSLVQMSTGIAERGRAARAQAAPSEAPVALPAQALDHGAGYLLAAVACRALVTRIERDQATVARLSLARVAHLLTSLGDHHDGPGRSLEPSDAAPFRETEDSALGTLLRVRVPGRIAGFAPRWSRPAGALGIDEARFTDD